MSGTSPAASREPTMQDIQEGLEVTRNQVRALHGRAERIVAAHIGPTEGRGEDGPTPIPSGFLHQALHTLREIGEEIDGLEKNLSRLEHLHGVKESRAEAAPRPGSVVQVERPFR